MAQKVIVKKPLFCEKELEEGNILFFEKIPFLFPQEEMDFLLQQKQSAARGRKNIAYKPQMDQITNHETDPQNAAKLKEILRNYSNRVATFLGEALPMYAESWTRDYTSFRPFEEKGRDLRLRARNDLLHVDAFPTRPLHGKRILRFFTNINPTEGRRWITADPISTLVEKYGGTSVPFPKAVGKIRRLLQWSRRSPYDQFMLQLHHFLKENVDFQRNCKKDQWDFPPLSCWAVYTDQVSHAALSGQYALEQTFLVPISALLFPDRSPLRILEKRVGHSLLI